MLKLWLSAEDLRPVRFRVMRGGIQVSPIINDYVDAVVWAIMNIEKENYGCHEIDRVVRSVASGDYECLGVFSLQQAVDMYWAAYGGNCEIE